MQCLFEDGVYLEVTLLKSLKTVALNRLSILCNLKVPMSAYLLHGKWPDGVNYAVVPSFIIALE